MLTVTYHRLAHLHWLRPDHSLSHIPSFEGGRVTGAEADGCSVCEDGKMDRCVTLYVVVCELSLCSGVLPNELSGRSLC